MMGASFLAERRRALRAIEIGNKPSEVEVRRGASVAWSGTLRVNYASLGGNAAQSLATDAEIVSFTVVSDDPDFDIRREDRVVCADGATGRVTTGRIVAVRAEPWGVEADATDEQ